MLLVMEIVVAVVGLGLIGLGGASVITTVYPFVIQKQTLESYEKKFLGLTLIVESTKGKEVKVTIKRK